MKHIDHIQFIVIDLFCGAGGTTTGFEEAEFDYQSMYRYLKSIGIDPPKDRQVFCKMAKVVACVNHDPIAIKSHWANHPEVEHFEEDITTLYGFTHKTGIHFKSAQFLRLQRLIEIYRACYPEAKIILWASLECTNFSKAKGGLSRDADSRTLADHLKPYITALDPDFIMIENVVEFMSWGPMIAKMGKTVEGFPFTKLHIKVDKNSKVIHIGPHLVPESKKKGKDWLRWRESICALGYNDQWKELNSADFGALTSRNRLFGCFAKQGLPIIWPDPTHAKKPRSTSLYAPLKKWEAVKPALDFSDEGKSVFNRKKPLSPKTMQRLVMGSIKHIAGGKDEYARDQQFIMKYYSGDPASKCITVDGPAGTIKCKDSQALVFLTKAFSSNSGKSVNAGTSIEQPCPTISAQNRLGVAKACFIQKYNSNKQGTGGNDGHSINDPSPVVSTQGRLALAQAHFIQKYYSTGGQHNSIEEPASTISTKDRLSKVSAFFIQKYYSTGENHQSIDEPSGSILPNDKHNLVNAEKWLMNTNYNNIGSSIENPSPVITADRHAHYLINPSWGGHSGSIEEPCHVVIARQDKAPLYFITCTRGPVSVPVYEGDCEWTVKLKEFMAVYGISDIKMRMLKVPELKVIQGFPKDYILLGNQSDQKKFIGNSVHPKVPKFMINAISNKLIELGIQSLAQAA